MIALPDGYQPESIATKGATFYVGSVADGAIVRGNVLTGRVTPFVAGTPGDATAGLEVSGNLLFAAGAGTGTLKVYDLRTGRKLVDRQVAPAGESFLNDVSVLGGHAYVTDSLKAQLYVLPFRGARSGRCARCPPRTSPRPPASTPTASRPRRTTGPCW